MTKGGAQPAVVLATTGEPRETAALRFAAAEALRTGYPVRVVHIVHGTTRDDPAHPLTYSTRAVDEAGRRLVEQAARRLEVLTHGSVPVVADVFRGRAADKLVALSAEAHLVVVQRRGLPRRRHPLSASTTAAVAGRAFAPVVSVPPGWDPDGAGLDGVTLAVGVLSRPTHLMQRALDTAREHRLPLTVVHVLDFPAVEGTDSAREQARRRAAARSGLDRSVAWLLRTYPELTVTTQVVLGPPASTVLAGVGPRQLLVVGRRDAPFPAYEHVGDVTRHLLRSATVPLVVVPRPSDPARPRPHSREHHLS